MAVDKPLTLRSVNGPQFTIIQGAKAPGGGNGNGAIRCAYLANGASLFGFTLTNGATLEWTEEASEQSGGEVWCESVSAVVSNCVVTGNSANWQGGGAHGGALNNCTLTGNSTEGRGGGAYSGTLNNCTLTGNSADGDGGGAAGGTLNNCVLMGNSASTSGGGASYSTLNNCTLTGNLARGGGGAFVGTLNNCIVYFNTAPTGANYDWATMNYCCTTPLPEGGVTTPEGGVGNIALDPQLASATHLSGNSPCRGAGSSVYATGTDIDGEPWANPPSIGCDEYHAGAVTGPLSVNIATAFTNVALGFPVQMTASIDGRTSASAWDFGDGLVLSNRPYATHAWTVAGDYTVELRAYNESHAEGVSATLIVRVVDEVHYVAADSAQPLPPYTSWATAARTIQDAVDVATVPGALVLVTNGTYAIGGRAVGTNILVNRVAVDKPLMLRSVNGPQFTIIQGAGGGNGDGAIRCVYLANGAGLSGFTLTKGATRTDGDWEREQCGGGVWCESASAVVSNCVLTDNSAGEGGGAFRGTLSYCTLTGNSADRGGGAYSGTLNNCTLTGNSAGWFGGGASYGTLNNCTLTGNLARYEGGGASGGTLNNCIVYFNTAPTEANYAYATLNYCCTTPLPTSSCFTNAPLFMDYAKGNLRLQANSPCINAGLNAYAPSGTDLDGNPRIVSGTVDIGAYEFQGTGSVISYAWLQQYALPIDGSADYADPDHDGLNNWQEWRCWTDPTNSLSALRLLSASSDGTNVTVNWQGVVGVNYFLERSTDLSVTPRFTTLAIGITGHPGTTTFTDTNAVPPALRFYRVGVGQ